MINMIFAWACSTLEGKNVKINFIRTNSHSTNFDDDIASKKKKLLRSIRLKPAIHIMNFDGN